ATFGNEPCGEGWVITPRLWDMQDLNGFQRACRLVGLLESTDALHDLCLARGDTSGIRDNRPPRLDMQQRQFVAVAFQNHKSKSDIEQTLDALLHGIDLRSH